MATDTREDLKIEKDMLANVQVVDNVYMTIYCCLWYKVACHFVNPGHSVHVLTYFRCHAHARSTAPSIGVAADKDHLPFSFCVRVCC